MTHGGRRTLASTPSNRQSVPRTAQQQQEEEKQRREKNAKQTARRGGTIKYTVELASPDEREVFKEADDTRKLKRQLAYKLSRIDSERSSRGISPESRAVQDKLDQAKLKWKELKKSDAMTSRTKYANEYAEENWRRFFQRDSSLQGIISNQQEPKDPSTLVNTAQADMQALAQNSEEPRGLPVFVNVTPPDMPVRASNNEETRDPMPAPTVDPTGFMLGLDNQPAFTDPSSEFLTPGDEVTGFDSETAPFFF